MFQPWPQRRDCPPRVLFVFATLNGDAAEAQLRDLACSLDPASYRLEVFPCVRSGNEMLHHELQRLGIDVDCTGYDLGFEKTVSYLAGKLAGCEVVVSCQDVADIYPALERLAHCPPLIEFGTTVGEALSGPKHLTARYVGSGVAVTAAAAARLPGRRHHARSLPSHGNAWFWESLFAEVQSGLDAPPPTLFSSFVQGGFEASTHRLRSGRRLDIIAATEHDRHAARDYRQLSDIGLRTVRDGARWHLIERDPGQYDFSSFLPMVEAAQANGTQVIWDLLHYGWPDDVDIWSPRFVDRFAAFAKAAARQLREASDEVPFWCPVNEISFLAWGGGEVGYLNPFGNGRGFELKVQLVRASIAAMRALREVDPRARFVQCEPLISIHHNPALDSSRAEAERFHAAQFEAAEMLSGRIWPQLGGEPSFLDILGVNYYSRNQWPHMGEPIDVGQPGYRPFSDLLVEAYARFGRPILIAETGIEGDRRASWFRYVAGEAERARQRGVPVEGICLYPILCHPGWDDDRDCPNGLLSQVFVGDARGTEPALLEAVRDEVARKAYAASISGRRVG